MYNTNAPDYPQTSTDEYFQYTRILVPGFSGLQVCGGPYGAVSSDQLSDGSTVFCANKDLPTDQFLKVADWVTENCHLIINLALESFVDQYWEMREIVINTLIDEKPEDVVPEISSHKDLKTLCGIVAVHVAGMDENGKPQYGLEFGCNWEDEHGAGVRFLGKEVVESGEASESFSF